MFKTGTLQILLPSWLYDTITIWFSVSDDSRPPPLEVDQPPEDVSKKNMRKNTVDDAEWLVFDPDLGVISRELQEQWRKESERRQNLFDDMKDRKKRQLPPVRK